MKTEEQIREKRKKLVKMQMGTQKGQMKMFMLLGAVKYLNWVLDEELKSELKEW